MVCALYPGSFNPIHSGHISIAKYIAMMPEIDQVRLILSPKNPLKDSSDLVDAYQRLDYVNYAIRQSSGDDEVYLGKISVSTVEFFLPEPLYTVNTLRYISKEEPDNTFIFIMGADNIAIIERWHNWEELLREYEIWVYPRTGFDGKGLCSHYDGMPWVRRVKYLKDAPLYNISSTEIRNSEKKSRHQTADK